MLSLFRYDRLNYFVDISILLSIEEWVKIVGEGAVLVTNFFLVGKPIIKFGPAIELRIFDSLLGLLTSLDLKSPSCGISEVKSKLQRDWILFKE